MMNKKIIILISIGLYLFSTGVSYFLFSGSDAVQDTDGVDIPKTAKIDNDYEAITFDPNAPKTEECPLNGAMYSKEQRAWWETHRPLGVMIENHVESRPQSGVNAADLVYEAVAEGGITRFMAVYHCNDAGIVGPVRSARTYFLDYISEYGEYPLYAHVGGANTPGPADALGQIDQYGWGGYNDLNQFAIGFPAFRRDQTRLGRTVATEHTMYSVTNKLWEVGEERGLTNEDEDGNSWDENFVQYSFTDGEPSSSTQAVSVDYWDGSLYAVTWEYDQDTNSYLRSNGGEEHMDRNTKEQIAAKNVVVLFMSESNANDGYPGNVHLLYGTTGSGDALIYQNGREIEGTWEKDDREARTIVYDENGDEVEFVRGKIWFMIQPLDGTVTAR